LGKEHTAMKTFYLTTPIYYPNARPHVGSAYTTIACDVIARYKRMCGYDVAFLTGTDEHGEKLERAAAAAGLSPRAFVAEKRKLFTVLWRKLGIENTHFVYTDQPDHVTSVQRLLTRARQRGYIDKRRYEGRYCVYDERYISDGTDPVDCDICGRPAELISEENYFFKLSAFEERLLNLYRRHLDEPHKYLAPFVQPSFRLNEVMSFVKSGLRDISVSRKRLKWGIPWPGDPEQVFYVWYDALTSYMTGIGYAQGEEGNEEFRKYWRNKPGESEIVHMIGKDILRFHTVYWPAFIMAAYPNQAEMLPTTVFAHGWIYYEQDKMSKSRGNVVYPEPIIDALDSFGAPGNDALRYYLLREAPFGEDMSFSYEGLIDRYNSDLAKGLGNLASRIITMLNQYFSGLVPERPSSVNGDEGTLKSEFFGDPGFGGGKGWYCNAFDSFLLSIAAARVQLLTSKLDGYLSKEEPWKIWAVRRGDFSSLKRILYTATDALRALAVLLYPVAPQSAERLWAQLGCDGELPKQNPRDLAWGQLKAGTKVSKPVAIFPRLDKAATLAKLEELAEADRERDKAVVGALREAPLQANVAEANRERERPKEAVKSVAAEKAPNSASPSVAESQTPVAAAGFSPAASAPNPEPRVPSPGSPAPSPEQKISIDDFAKVDMRVGEILSAEPIPGAKKLLKLQVDIGTEVRQVCAGIAEHYRPEQLVGVKVVLVANLHPRKLRGIESDGMIVAASVGEEGKPLLATFTEEVPKGARLK
jgi:methionyl-tRNA synthetase